MSKILIIDDETDICFLISEILMDELFICETATNSNAALIKYNNFNPDLIILDVWLGNSDLDGIELLLKFKNLNPQIPIIIISGHGTVDMAVNSIKNGAYDFIEKPFNSEKLIITSKRALESALLLKENNKLKLIVKNNISLIGISNFIKKFQKDLYKISNSNSRVFISGNSGSGKKLFSQHIHQNSIFYNNLCTIIDFKNIDEEEVETLFSDNSAQININILAKSNNTTLILENIDHLTIKYQKKFLFLLENNQFFIKNNIILKQKIVSLSSKNINIEINNGNFIKDLYDRLSIIKINIPPINERREDILPICEYYLKFYNKNSDRNFLFSSNAQSKLELYDWPGNVSQIINYAEKIIILNQNLNNQKIFKIDKLPSDMGEVEIVDISHKNFQLSLREARNNFEKDYLLSQIKRFNGNIKKISDFTGMERTALYRKFKSLKIKIDNN